MKLRCDQFDSRLHKCLDARLPISNDHDLAAHCAQCVACRTKLRAWKQIEAVVAPANAVIGMPTENLARLHKMHWLSIATAAIVLIAFTLVTAYEPVRTQIVALASVSPPVPKPLTKSSADQSITLDERMIAEMDPTRWWQQLQDRDWLGQTMPTVRSVQEGVAPLGRSLRRAVTILTTGRQDQTS